MTVYNLNKDITHNTHNDYGRNIIKSFNIIYYPCNIQHFWHFSLLIFIIIAAYLISY